MFQAWKLYKDDQLLQLMDPAIKQECVEKEVDQFLKVGLLCVQEMPNLRPPMSRVVEMLSTEMDTRELQISQPGVIKDLQILKIGQTPGAVKHAPSQYPSQESSLSSL